MPAPLTKQKTNVIDEIKKSVTILQYAHEAGFTLEKVGRYYTLTEHDSVRIDPDKNYFWRNSTGAKGDVIDFVKEMENVDTSGAIKILSYYANIPNRDIRRDAPAPARSEQTVETNIGDMPIEDYREIIAVQNGFDSYQDMYDQGIRLGDGYDIEPTEQAKIQDEPEQNASTKPFTLPEKAGHNRNVYAYLTKTRGIDPEFVRGMLHDRRLYQDTRGNCVFVAFDAEGNPNFGCMRGTNTEKSFKRDVAGSDYDKGFFINGGDTLVVTESVIDALSLMTIYKRQGLDPGAYSYLATSGTSKLKCVVNQLKENDGIKSVVLALDNDKAGHLAADRIREDLTAMKWDGSVYSAVPVANDWNEELLRSRGANMEQAAEQKPDKDLDTQSLEIQETPAAPSVPGQALEPAQELQTALPTVVVNLFAGPGAGKTTCAWEIASDLKKRGVNTEYVPEYAKELVWDNNMELLDGSFQSQIKIFEEQNRRIARLIGKVDVVVTDSPLLLGAIYTKDRPRDIEKIILKQHSQYHNFNLFINRGDGFEQAGRIHTLNQSRQIDVDMKAFLDRNGIYYGRYKHETVPVVTRNIQTHLQKLQNRQAVRGNAEVEAAAQKPLTSLLGIETTDSEQFDVFPEQEQEAEELAGDPIRAYCEKYAARQGKSVPQKMKEGLEL